MAQQESVTGGSVASGTSTPTVLRASVKELSEGERHAWTPRNLPPQQSLQVQLLALQVRQALSPHEQRLQDLTEQVAQPNNTLSITSQGIC